MYICMYVCRVGRYACIFLCMYLFACIYFMHAVSIDEFIRLCILINLLICGVFLFVCLLVCEYVCVCVCVTVCVCVYVCVCVCVCVCICDRSTNVLILTRRWRRWRLCCAFWMPMECLIG
jgi:hypothetical protein